MNAENQQETIGQPFSWTELAKVGQEARNTHRLLAKTRPPQEGACPADEECREQQGGFTPRRLRIPRDLLIKALGNLNKSITDNKELP